MGLYKGLWIEKLRGGRERGIPGRKRGRGEGGAERNN